MLCDVLAACDLHTMNKVCADPPLVLLFAGAVCFHPVWASCAGQLAGVHGGGAHGRSRRATSAGGALRGRPRPGRRSQPCPPRQRRRAQRGRARRGRSAGRRRGTGRRRGAKRRRGGVCTGSRRCLPHVETCAAPCRRRWFGELWMSCGLCIRSPCHYVLPKQCRKRQSIAAPTLGQK